MVMGLVNWCKLIPADAVGLEIGSFAGESSLIMLETIPNLNLTCVDLWKSDYYRENQIPVAEKTFDAVVRNRVTKIKDFSDEAFNWFIIHRMKFDFVYIDGNHNYEFVKKDIINALKVIKVGGILGGHDYKYKKSAGVAKALLEVMGREPDFVFPDYSFAYKV
jgi:predicted O-methyltransferase YrrM